MLLRRNGGVERNGNGRRCEPSQSRKESILNCLLMGNRGLYRKVKEGLDLEDRIKKISDFLEEGKLLAGKKRSGSENSVSLFR